MSKYILDQKVIDTCSKIFKNISNPAVIEAIKYLEENNLAETYLALYLELNQDQLLALMKCFVATFGFNNVVLDFAAFTEKQNSNRYIWPNMFHNFDFQNKAIMVPEAIMKITVNALRSDSLKAIWIPKSIKDEEIKGLHPFSSDTLVYFEGSSSDYKSFYFKENAFFNISKDKFINDIGEENILE